MVGLFKPEEFEVLALDAAGLFDNRPENVNANGEFIYRVSGYEGFPAIYARRVSSR